MSVDVLDHVMRRTEAKHESLPDAGRACFEEATALAELREAVYGGLSCEKP
jgi:hypothetical protein